MNPEYHQSLGIIVSRSPNPTDAIDKAAQWFARSGLFGCDRVEQGAILALTCISEGISPVEFSRTYDICEGKLRKKAMAAFADFRKRDGKVKWIATGEDGLKAEAEFTFEGQTVRLAFTMDQAKTAGLVKDKSGWQRNPANMLRARLISNALGMLCPEIYAGEYDEEKSPAPVAQINLGAIAAPPSTPTPDAASATVVNIEATPVVDAAAPVPPTPPPPASESPSLPTDIQEKLVAAIGGERIPAATVYCKKVGWLAEGEQFDQLPLKRANQILARVDRFISAIDMVAK